MTKDYATLCKHLREKASRDNRELLDEAAAAIEELTRSQWIPVNERLPEPDEAVLVICSGTYKNVTLDLAVVLACWIPEEQDWCLESFPTIENAKISYWAPIPRLPQGLRGGDYHDEEN